MKRKTGFTLIELLIVVVIIAILAAIAVPNLLEAQTRSKISRVMADQRGVVVALEAYRVDQNAYPRADENGITIFPKVQRLRPLTTPIAYLTIVPPDIFSAKTDPAEKVMTYLDNKGYWESNWYALDRPDVAGLRIKFFLNGSEGWLLMSYGPSRQRSDLTDGLDWNDSYDATNGTCSLGMIIKPGP